MRMGSRAGTLVAGVAGLLYPILSIGRLFFTGEVDAPALDDSPAAIVAFYEAADFDTTFTLGIAMVAVGYALLIVFIAKVADVVGGLDAGSRWVGYVILGGAVLDVVLALGYVATYATAVFWSSNGGLTADVYLALHGLAYGGYWVELITISLWLAPLGIAIAVTGLFPRWLGALMVISAAANVVAFFLPTVTWNIVGGLPYIWILLAAIWMLARADRYSLVAQAPDAPAAADPRDQQPVS